MLPLCHGLAFVSLQLAFQRGSALATAGVSSLLNNLPPIVAGFVVFYEHMPGGLPGVLRGLASPQRCSEPPCLQARAGRAGRVRMTLTTLVARERMPRPDKAATSLAGCESREFA